MSNEILASLEAEQTDLSLHVQLCEQRYLQLLSKFDAVDHKFDKIENMLVEITDKLKKDTTDNYLKWGGAIIGILSTTLIGLVIKLLLH
jgi:tetrahydromethanopterin S-methyltransferase subunit G